LATAPGVCRTCLPWLRQPRRPRLGSLVGRQHRKRQRFLALEAAANALDTDLTADLGAMIERSEAELVELNAKIKALPLS
jgi:hypothetical protein